MAMRALKRERATTLSNPRQKTYFGHWRAIAGLLAVPFLSACSFGGSGNGATSVSPLLVGRWRQISIATADASANCPASVSVGDGYSISCGGNDVLEFNSDGTFTATSLTVTFRGWERGVSKELNCWYFSRLQRMLQGLSIQLR